MRKNDWRLMENKDYLFGSEINPVCSEDILEYWGTMKSCVFCLDKVGECPSELWYIPVNKSCCICESCFKDFKLMFDWKLLDGWDVGW